MRKSFVLLFLFFFLCSFRVDAETVEIVPDVSDGVLVMDPVTIDVMDASESSIRFDRLDNAVSGTAMQLDLVTELVSAQAVSLEDLAGTGQRNADSYEELADAYLGLVTDQKETTEYITQLRNEIMSASGPAIEYDDTRIRTLLTDIRDELVRTNKYLAFVFVFGIFGIIVIVSIVIFRLLAGMLRNADIM